MALNNECKVAIVSATDSFLAKSLTTKLGGEGITSTFVHADISEITPIADELEMLILFMTEELVENTDSMVYINDMIMDNEWGLILIGEETQYDLIKSIIPEHMITRWFKRPLDIEMLIKEVSTFLVENTDDNKKRTVLIVDDDVTYMRTVYEWLKGYYHVGMAQSGVQAISYLAKNKADLVLLDYEMPIANGPQVLSMLQNDTETGQIPVMFLTGHSDKDSVVSALNLKPADYLLKTIDKKSLLEKLELFFKTNHK